jgi:uncharacterized protein YbjT (DUF2867 family)
MIVVTAPTERIGSRLLPLLSADEEPLRVIARDPGRIQAALPAGSEVIAGSHRDRDVVDAALAGTDIAATLSEVVGRPIRLEPGDREQDLGTFVDRGYSPAMAQGLLDMEIAAERGINTLGPEVSRAETPTTFRQFAAESIVPALHG